MHRRFRLRVMDHHTSARVALQDGVMEVTESLLIHKVVTAHQEWANSRMSVRTI